MKYALLFFLVCAFYIVCTPQTFAQSQNSITVSPQLIELDLSKDLPEAEYTYSNNTKETIELTLSMQDVKELDDRGIPGLIEGDEAKNYKYGLTSWAEFSNKNLVLPPGQSQKVTVFIDKERLTLGGHYAAVLAEIKQLDDKKAVRLRAILTSLLFTRTNTGLEAEDAEISSFYFLQNFYNFPKSSSFRFQNNGNVHLAPHGIVTIYDPLGRVVARDIVNEDSLITLPSSHRDYRTKVSQNIKILPPGIYNAKIY